MVLKKRGDAVPDVVLPVAAPRAIKDTLFCSRGLNFRAMDWAGILQGQNQATVAACASFDCKGTAL